LKNKTDFERSDLRKREHKSLMKSLKLAQMSTASMGRFDKKAGKNEPAAATTQKIKKKSSNKHLHDLEQNRGSERERNMKIFDMLQRKQEIGSGGLTNKANGHLNENTLAKSAKKKNDKAHRKANAK